MLGRSATASVSLAKPAALYIVNYVFETLFVSHTVDEPLVNGRTPFLQLPDYVALTGELQSILLGLYKEYEFYFSTMILKRYSPLELYITNRIYSV